jgi:hypothetical protein
MEHKIKHEGIKIMVFWIVMPHRLLDRCQCFGGNILHPFLHPEGGGRKLH